MLSNQIAALLSQASLTAKISNDIAEMVTLSAIIITPKKQIKALGVDGMMEAADFVKSRCDVMQVSIRLQPGVYNDDIVPYRDDLEIHILVDSGSETKLRAFVGVPLLDRDVRAESNNTADNNMDAQNFMNMIPYKFQLIDKGFAKLKNVQVSNIYQMSNPADVLATVMEEETKKVGLESWDAFRGVYMHKPVDNTNKYRQIILPSGTRLVDVPGILQEHNEYGVYSKGLGCYYKQRYWWIYPLYNTTLAETYKRPLDIIRVPQNKIPDLKSTFYRSDVGMTIVAAGEARHSDGADIKKQNQGTGQRIIMGDAIAGDTGYHYNNGRAITTRADSLQEYKLSDRRDGEEFIPLNPNPTGNVCAALSINSMNEGEIVQVEWRNGDVGYLEPGHPLRYQYMENDEQMKVRTGVLLGYRCDYKPITTNPEPAMKRTTILYLFLKRAAKYKVEQTA
uniref:Virion structural protein n=1 Tax=Pantoea phage Survivor TaxID=3232176 RepID=A0AAU8KY72_9CAUD